MYNLAYVSSCEGYAGRYERESVVRVVSSAAAIPAPLAARMAERQESLLGAALWLLDYWDGHCGDTDEYLSLLPPEPDEDRVFDVPFSGELAHSWDIIHRTMTVLCDREKEYRKEYRALLALIDENDGSVMAVLRQQFKAAFLDYTDRALEVYTRLQLPAVGAGEGRAGQPELSDRHCDGLCHTASALDTG